MKWCVCVLLRTYCTVVVYVLYTMQLGDDGD